MNSACLKACCFSFYSPTPTPPPRKMHPRNLHRCPIRAAGQVSSSASIRVCCVSFRLHPISRPCRLPPRPGRGGEGQRGREGGRDLGLQHLSDSRRPSPLLTFFFSPPSSLLPVWLSWTFKASFLTCFQLKLSYSQPSVAPLSPLPASSHFVSAPFSLSVSVGSVSILAPRLVSVLLCKCSRGFFFF